MAQFCLDCDDKLGAEGKATISSDISLGRKLFRLQAEKGREGGRRGRARERRWSRPEGEGDGDARCCNGGESACFSYILPRHTLHAGSTRTMYTDMCIVFIYSKYSTAETNIHCIELPELYIYIYINVL